MVTLDEMKTYLKVEYEEDDDLISSLMETCQQLCQDILRLDSPSETPVLKTAILYGVAYLYEHREEADHKGLKETLYHLLLSDRKDVF